MRPITRRRFGQGAAAMAAGIALPAHAAYPDRDITFILNWNLSGSTYPVSKLFCAQLEKYLGNNAKIVIESRPGGTGTIGMGQTVRAKPDGYTIGYSGNVTLAYMPLVNKGLPWKSVDDVQPLVKLFDMPTLLVVPKASPWNNFDDFMAAVRANPGQIKVGVPGVRTSADMSLLQINRYGKVQIRSVPFTGGTGESIIAMMGGRIEALCGYTESVRGQVDAGLMKVIGVFAKQPYYPYPDATPIAAKHFPWATLPATNHIIAPKGIPPEILDKLIKGSYAAVTSNEFKTFARTAGMLLDPEGPEGVRKEVIEITETYIDIIKFLDGTAPESPYKKS